MKDTQDPITATEVLRLVAYIGEEIIALCRVVETLNQRIYKLEQLHHLRSSKR